MAKIKQFATEILLNNGKFDKFLFAKVSIPKVKV